MADNVPAFPRSGGFGSPGMSLRDWFAGQVAAEVLRQVMETSARIENVGKAVAQLSYQVADAMLAERGRQP
jgi:hypothetical protein